jgi:hypothetical protein
MVSSPRACPPQAECWCCRLARRPNVSLIWQQTRLPNRLEPWIANDKEFSEPVTPDHKSLMACSPTSRSSRFAAALRADLDLSSARHLQSLTVGTKSWPAIKQRADQQLDTTLPHVSNPDCLLGETLDCFATLAMTECAAAPQAAFPPIYSGSQRSNEVRSASIVTGASPAIATASPPVVPIRTQGTSQPRILASTRPASVSGTVTR